MHEERVIDLRDGIVLAKPPAVDALGSKGIAPLEETDGMRGDPRRARLVINRMAVLCGELLVVLPLVGLPLLGLVRREAAIVLHRDVPRVTDHIHDFMVAEHGDYLAVLLGRFGLE